jgi:hypothetical protein
VAIVALYPDAVPGVPRALQSWYVSPAKVLPTTWGALHWPALQQGVP